MKKLMKLVGLKNFKNVVIDLFEFALKIEQLDPEVKQANPIMFNYCFVGNGVSSSITEFKQIRSRVKKKF